MSAVLEVHSASRPTVAQIFGWATCLCGVSEVSSEQGLCESSPRFLQQHASMPCRAGRTICDVRSGYSRRITSHRRSCTVVFGGTVSFLFVRTGCYYDRPREIAWCQGFHRPRHHQGLGTPAPSCETRLRYTCGHEPKDAFEDCAQGFRSLGEKAIT